jgi:HTH-type transcriptional regulator, glycine betaine synthesis regulator
MNDVETSMRKHFIRSLSRIARFWGFPKAMGAAYAAVYLSPEPISLDDIVDTVEVTKGGLSPHLRMLERLGIVRREGQLGDRKDYYVADTDFWGALRRILQEREKREFDRALHAVSECLTMLDSVPRERQGDPTLAFYRERLSTMKRFFDGLDRIIATILAMESFREAALGKLFGRHGKTSGKERHG